MRFSNAFHNNVIIGFALHNKCSRRYENIVMCIVCSLFFNNILFYLCVTNTIMFGNDGSYDNSRRIHVGTPVAVAGYIHVGISIIIRTAK